MATFYVGIDPGWSGGMVVLDAKSNMDYYYRYGGSVLKVWNRFYELHERYEYDELVFGIEHVHARPTNGRKASFRFGMSYACALMGVLNCTGGVPPERFLPKTWQKAFNLEKKKKYDYNEHKELLRAHAQELFPSIDLWSKSMAEQKAICDALLIALYLQQRHAAKAS